MAKYKVILTGSKSSGYILKVQNEKGELIDDISLKEEELQAFYKILKRKYELK